MEALISLGCAPELQGCGQQSGSCKAAPLPFPLYVCVSANMAGLTSEVNKGPCAPGMTANPGITCAPGITANPGITCAQASQQIPASHVLPASQQNPASHVLQASQQINPSLVLPAFQQILPMQT
eukprot:1159904-Pelagomonas_calceolata.AAC.5